MSIPCKFERSILNYDEHEVILRSHHLEIYDTGLDDLKALRQRLRDLRDKERSLAREKRREVRGKGPPRGESFPGAAEHPLRRKQVGQQGDRSHAQAGGAGCARQSSAPHPRHAPCGSVSCTAPDRRHSK